MGQIGKFTRIKLYRARCFSYFLLVIFNAEIAPSAYDANLYITSAITCLYKSHRQIKFWHDSLANINSGIPAGETAVTRTCVHPHPPPPLPPPHPSVSLVESILPSFSLFPPPYPQPPTTLYHWSSTLFLFPTHIMEYLPFWSVTMCRFRFDYSTKMDNAITDSEKINRSLMRVDPVEMTETFLPPR